LERITPHLKRALQIRHQFVRGDARAKTLEDILNRSATGLIGLPFEGPALFVNRRARAIASAQDGLALDRRGRPVLSDRAAKTELDTLEGDVSRGGAGGFVRVTRPSGCPPYIILVARLPAGNSLIPDAAFGVLYAIYDPATHRNPEGFQIAGLLNITASSAKLVNALLGGMDLKEYAEHAGISVNTVRFHLKNAFAATGTHSQAELVRLALSTLCALDPYLPETSGGTSE
ncbi:MAG: helix-turn-helix transcriptional regulator, partial [Xanthobacteraceae bacterium]|nr:helix-turn-helix transcriptional regulator [Xanthobacteraceae bacterium]